MTAAEAAILEGLLEDAAQSMQRLSGGMAVCTFTRAGKAVPGVKYAEGRWAALRETHRKVSATHSVADVVAQVSTTWQPALLRSRERNAGADWIAYYTGGLDALAELADRVGDAVHVAGSPARPDSGSPLGKSNAPDRSRTR